MQEKWYDKLYGGLLGAAVGDSMGTVSEGFAPEFLQRRYGGMITDLLQPTDDGMTVQARAGMVSDDFSVAYYTAQILLEQHSKITHELACEGLKRWWKHPEYTCYCGPSTRNGILKLLAGQTGSRPQERFNNTLASNGAGMKSGMMGLFNPGDPAGAVRDALTMCLPTHNNAISLSAAAAVAAATAAAFLPGAGYMELIRAGLEGAAQGERECRDRVVDIAGCSVVRRMELAVELGMRCQGDAQRAISLLGDIVGAGLYAYEAIPAAFGVLAACRGNLMEGLILAVNLGDDADSTACMVGYMLGALEGVGALPPHFARMIDRENGFDLAAMARGIGRLVEGGAQ